MPYVDVVFYREDDGLVPVLAWLDNQPATVQNKCWERIQRLERLGHEARRPLADNLGNSLYELRIKCQTDNYRILYFFHGRTVAVLAASFKKNQGRIPQGEIDHALYRKQRFEVHPDRHTYKEDNR